MHTCTQIANSMSAAPSMSESGRDADKKSPIATTVRDATMREHIKQ